MGYGCGWNDCGCGTIYTDAWGRAINDVSGAATSSTGSSCGPPWGLIAMAALGAFAAISLTQPKGK